MLVSQILEQFYKQHPTYRNIGYSLGNVQYSERLHPLFVFTQYIIDTMISKGEKRIAIVLPDDDCNILPFILAKCLQNNRGDNKKRYFVKSNVVNAADYGVPQARKRFVLHAIRYDLYEVLSAKGLSWDLPQRTHSKNGQDGLPKWVTVRAAFEGLPAISAGQRYSDDKIKNHDCANLSSVNIRRMQIIRANGGTRTSLPPDLVLNCHKEYSGHTDVYGIMNPDEPSPTITGGCLSYSKGRFGHPFEDRAISAREAARLQTFPDDYIFGESLTKTALQIGNAVPIKLVKASAKEILSIIKKLQ